jgi:hypothetical protein
MRWVLFACVAVLAVGFGSQASANPVCHSVLTSDTTLTGNLDCSGVPGDPLTVGADGITIRLNGFTLTGPPGFVNSGGELDVECVFASGRTGVRVLGPGTITGCGRGVTFQGGSHDEVAGILLTGNLTGIVFQGGANHLADDNLVEGNLGNGIELSGVSQAQILDNVIQDNGGDSNPSRGFGLTNDNASTATICRDRILHNVRGGIGEVGASALTSTICDSIVLDNGGFDLNLRGTDDTVVNTVCRTSSPAGLCQRPRPVPEPATLLLLCSGTAAFIARGWRRGVGGRANGRGVVP